MVHRPKVYCPLCQSDPGDMQTTHLILEEDFTDEGEGLGDLISRNCMDLFDLSDEDCLEEITVHTYCWAIAKRVFKRESYDQIWIDQFIQCLDHLTPFIITQAPFPQEADQLDYDIFATLKPALYDNDSNSNSAAAESPDIKTAVVLSLPVELIFKIYDLLEAEEDIVNLSDVIGIGPLPEIWKELGEKYMLAPDLDPRANVSTLIRNFQRRPKERYPRTTNYRVIWKNMELLKARMDDAPIVNTLSDEELNLGGNTIPCEGYRIRLPRKKDMFLTAVFNVDANSFGKRICGIGFNGKIIGNGALGSKTVAFSGLRAFGAKFLRNPRCCIGVLVGDQNGERSIGDWKKTLSIERCDYQMVEWEDGGELLVKFEHQQSSAVSIPIVRMCIALNAS